VVQNVQAEPGIAEVTLTWSPVSDTSITGYRIYIGTGEVDAFEYTLDADASTPAAVITGLKGGTTYRFALTAVKGDQESESLSELLQTTTLGVNIEVTPQDGGLILNWSSFQIDVQVGSFLLEYGLTGEELAERRTLNGQLRLYVLRDLLNDVPYTIRLTPIDETGVPMADLATTVQAIPSSTRGGFHPAPTEGLPFPLVQSSTSTVSSSSVQSASSSLLPAAPAITETGFSYPFWRLLAIVGILVGLIVWYTRRQRAAAQHFMQTVQKRSGSSVPIFEVE